jgi:cytochrome P450
MTTTRSDAPVCSVELLDSALYAGGPPYDVLRELRAEAPLQWHGPAVIPDNYRPEGVAIEGFWIALGHPEIVEINRDWERFRAEDGPTITALPPEMRGTALIWMDPPDHTRLRKLVSSGFTPRMLRRLDELLVRRTRAILDAASEKGEFDFVSEVAFQLPMHVIADIVGIPEDERSYVFSLTEGTLHGSAGRQASGPRGAAAQLELLTYAEDLSARKLAEPGNDIWTELTQASITADDGGTTRLGKTELDFFLVILAVAGSETTRNALSQGLLALLQHPDQLAELRADPGLCQTASEEIIRWSSPVLFFGRTAAVDTQVGDAHIRAGDRVTMWYPAGNRDERVFAQPDTFDIRRTPNPHVSFGGGGAHYCLGANLAKREVQVMTSALIERFDIEQLGPAVWGGGGPTMNVGIGVNELPVRLSAR